MIDRHAALGITPRLLDRLRALLHDPDRTVLHRALRIAVVMPLLFAFGLKVLGDGQFALLAAFGSFSAMAMADFTGPRQSRLSAYLGLGVVGVVLVALGTALSNTLWPAVVAMLLVGAMIQFAAALGGQFSLGNNAAILAFVISVMVPAGIDAIPSRVGGWIVAIVCSAIATALWWPRHERRDLYQRLVEACRALANIARTVAEGNAPGSALDAAAAAITRVREAQGALGFRPIGPPGHQQALLGLIDSLGQCRRFAELMVAAPMSATDRRLALVIATTLDAVAGVLAGCAEDHPGAGPDISALITARHTHKEALDAAAITAVAANAPAASVVTAIRAAFPVRVLSFTVLSMATDAIVLTGRVARVEDDDFGVNEPTAPVGRLRHVSSVLAPHLSPSSVWFRNSLRAGVALGLSVLVAKVSDIQHAFWVVLATLTVLRSNVATTGSTVVSAVIGTFAGFLLATLAMSAFGSNPMVLWISLPIAVFLGAYAPAAISLGAGQAMFALLVVELFNLIVPAGWETGAVRLEAVVLGALVALTASLIMWPQGAAAALRAEVALHIRTARHLTKVVFGALLGGNDGAEIEPARAATLRARRRAEEALAAYAGERGAKRVSLAVWQLLVRTPVSIRAGDDAIIVLWRAGYGAVGTAATARPIEETVASVCASFAEFAERLDHPDSKPDPALGAIIADLNLVDGTGNRRAEIAAAVADWIEAHRGDSAAIAPVIGFLWAADWLGYLAHLRAISEPALDEVLAHADTPWWR